MSSCKYGDLFYLFLIGLHYSGSVVTFWCAHFAADIHARTNFLDGLLTLYA